MNPEVERLEDLLDAVLRAAQQAIASGNELSEELQNLIAEQVSYLTQQIESLLEAPNNQNPADNLTPNVPQLDQGPFPSSNVNSFKYDPSSGRLFVKFHGTESADSGPVYKYENVPQNIYDLFSKGRVAPTTSGQNQYHRWIRGVTPSLGASLYALIRNGGYPYQRMS